jgi:peroxiredoxin
MKAKGFLFASVLALAGAVIYSSVSAAAKEDKPAPATAVLGAPAPDFTLKDAFGKEFKLSEFKDKIVVLEWLNQDCPVSRGAHQKKVMQEVYRKYAGKGVVWLGMCSTAGEKPDRNRVYAAAQGLAYPILHDADGKVGHAYQAKTTPHLFIVDKTGKLAYTGAIDDRKEKNYVANALDELLEDKPVSTPKTEPYGCGVKYANNK